MKSKNKPAQDAHEARYVSIVANLDCVVCGAYDVEIHEFEQGLWWTSVPLCYACHRGPDGWHGTRQRWTLRKFHMLRAINETVEAVFRGLGL